MVTVDNAWSPELTLSTAALVDTALSGKTGTADELRLFDTENYAGASYTRNAGCWLAAYATALTGVSVGNSRYGKLGGGIFLDTPDRDIVVIMHHGFYETMVGQTMRFVAADNTVRDVTVSDDVRVTARDIRVLKLSAPMHASISPVKLLQNNPGHVVNGVGFPLVFLDQDKNVMVTEQNFAFADSGAASLRQAAASPRSLFWQTPITGDSGQPVFMLTSGGIACMGHVYSLSTSAGYLDGVKTAIEAVITDLGSDATIGTQTI